MLQSGMSESERRVGAGVGRVTFPRHRRGGKETWGKGEERGKRLSSKKFPEQFGVGILDSAIGNPDFRRINVDSVFATAGFECEVCYSS